MKFWMKLCSDFYTEKKRRPTWSELAEMIGDCDAEGIRNFAQKQASKSSGALFYFKIVEKESLNYGKRVTSDISFE